MAMWRRNFLHLGIAPASLDICFLILTILIFHLQSLIRTAEQLKIKGLCEINDHTNTVESDSEVIYPPHKKIRASRNYENNNSLSNSNKNLPSEFPSTAKSSTNVIDKDAHQSIASNEDNSKHKTKSPTKDSKSASGSSSTQQGKNMASLEMGMVSTPPAVVRKIDF